MNGKGVELAVPRTVGKQVPEMTVRMHRAYLNRLLVERCQLRTVIGDVHSEEARRLCCARILTDEMVTSGWLKEAFTGLVDFHRSGRGIFGTDRPEST
jgi:hypothetical protein